MSKRRKFGWLVPTLLLVCLLGLGAAGLFRPPEQGVQARVVGMPTEPARGEYERAFEPRELVFPLDHGPHPNFQTEWWYYTGNLSTPDGRRFGYQLTFFRSAVTPASEWPERASDWSTNQIYMAHFTLSDVQDKQFHYFERFERGAAGLAGATGDPSYSVWLHDWSVEQTSADTYRLRAQSGPVALDLTLIDRKGIVLQGEGGLSQKGPQAGNASLYYSQTRLESAGTVTVDGVGYTVNGLSWLDREISTSALSEGQVGWDWFALQLDDGSELMAYVLRRKDGTVDAFSSGTFVRPDGQTVTLKREDFQVTSSATWRSPHSGGTYPARWTVRVPGEGLELDIQPLLADQELNVSFTYWEGAVEISGTRAGKPVKGYGYVELTGYAESLEGEV